MLIVDQHRSKLKSEHMAKAFPINQARRDSLGNYFLSSSVEDFWGLGKQVVMNQ